MPNKLNKQQSATAKKSHALIAQWVCKHILPAAALLTALVKTLHSQSVGRFLPSLLQNPFTPSPLPFFQIVPFFIRRSMHTDWCLCVSMQNYVPSNLFEIMLCSLAEAFFPPRWAFLFYENYLNFNNSIWMSFIYVCFHFLFPIFSVHRIVVLSSSKNTSKNSLSLSLSAVTLPRLFYLFVKQFKLKANTEKKWYSDGCFCFWFFLRLLTRSRTIRIHILLPLFAIHFTVALARDAM